MDIFTAWWFWVVIAIAFGIPLLSWLIKFIAAKTGMARRKNSSKNAEHVRKAVEKYEKKRSQDNQ